jgi:hypothetical protein
MSKLRGRDGTVKVGAGTIAEIRDWSLERTASTMDGTVLNDEWSQKDVGIKGWSGSLNCFQDETDTTGQALLEVGETVTLNFYPGGDTAGLIERQGSAIVTSVSDKGANEGFVERSISFEGTGPLARAVVV